MRKTPTIFDRDWDGNRGVVPKIVTHPGGAQATEKIDGTNVRVTVRSGLVVRVEARQNPTKQQKKDDGITEPWYRDARADDPADAYILEAVALTPTEAVPDGEWSGEAVGPKIQGNPLELDDHQVRFFDTDRLPAGICVPWLEGVPTCPYPANPGQVAEFFHALRRYMDAARSEVNPAVGIEGIVWHGGDGWAKLKRKDFK